MQKKNVKFWDCNFMENWISLLVRRGYDLVATNGHTTRAESDEDRWNSNHPITTIHFFLEALPEQKAKVPQIIITAYGTNGRIDTIYATGFSGKAERNFAGFTVIGTRETPISTFEDLEKLLENVPYRNY